MFLEKLLVVAFYDRLHIWHTAIRNLHIIPVKYLVESMCAWEMFIDEVEKSPAHIGFHGAGKRRIEPNYIPFPRLRCLQLDVRCIASEFHVGLCIPTSAQGILVVWLCGIKGFFAGGDVVNPVAVLVYI